MKTLFASVPALFLFLATHETRAATTTLELTYSVFSNTAVGVYPSVNFGPGTPAKFTFQYDPGISPYFTGSVVTDSGGVPILDGGMLVYNTTVAPGSSMSNESRYNIIGNIAVEIGGFTWSGSNYNLIIYNNFPSLTPLDGLFFEFDLVPTSPFAEPIHKVQLSFSSNLAPLTLVGNTALPDQNDDLDRNNIQSANMALRPQAGGWVINSGSLSTVGITTIPEPGICTLLVFSSLLLLRRQARAGAQ